MWKRYFLLLIIFSGIFISAKAQNMRVAATISEDSIIVGDKIAYELVVPATNLDSVIFPEFPEDTLTEEIAILKNEAPSFNAEKKLVSRKYYLSAYKGGDWEIPMQNVIVNPNSDSLIYSSNSLNLHVLPAVIVDTLKVDTIYAKHSGVVVFGRNNFISEVEQQIPDSVKQSMSSDSLSMLEDTVRKMYIQQFGGELFRASGLREQKDISQIVGAVKKRFFLVDSRAILENHRIPGAYDTVFVQEFDTVALNQPLYTVHKIKDINDELYNTPFNFKEFFFYIWRFIKNNYWWLIGIVFVVLVIIYFVFYYSKGKQVFHIKVAPPEPAHIIALRGLDLVKSDKLWLKSRVKDYYTDLTNILRKYLENRFDISAMDKTSAEILYMLKDTNYLDESLVNSLKEILERADFVKFAKSMPLPNENEKSLDMAYDIINRSKEIHEENIQIVESELENNEQENQ